MELQSPRPVGSKLKELGQMSRSGHWPKLAQMSGFGNLAKSRARLEFGKKFELVKTFGKLAKSRYGHGFPSI